MWRINVNVHDVCCMSVRVTDTCLVMNAVFHNFNLGLHEVWLAWIVILVHLGPSENFTLSELFLIKLIQRSFGFSDGCTLTFKTDFP